MSACGWIVTRDHLDKKDVEVMGPSGISDEMVARLKAGEGAEFQMRDDDGELYYSGRCIHTGGEDAMRPLDDYGDPNAGCTSIEYKNASGEFEAI